VVGVGFVRELPTSYDLQPSGDGAYSLPPLPPGQYEMLLSYDNGLKNQLRSEFDLNWRPFDPIARVPFEIDDADVDLGVLGDPPRTSVPGRVEVRRSAGGSEIGLEQLPTVSLGDVHYILGSETRRAVPGDDGAFLIEDAYPGSFVLGVRQGDLPLGWYVESVRSGGIDLLREELLVGGGQVSPIQVVIANDAGRIEGIVRGGDDQPVPDAHVVLIPPIGGRGPATRFPAVTADASGVFALERLRPGEYRLLALDLAGRDGAGVFWESPDFLRQYGLRGGRITVDPGARLTINPEAIPLVE
jgi:hypothetical protein